MKLDAARLRAEADAHRARLESPLWTPSGGESDEDWMPPRPAGAQSTARSATAAPAPERPPDPEPLADAPDVATPEIVPRLEALARTVERLTQAVHHRSLGNEGVPDWLESAAGNPHTYDAPDSDRTGVCVRILPTTYSQLQQTQRRMGLRTTAGAWEFLLRLGLAAAQHLPP